MANDEVLGPRKTMFVLVIVVGCFAVLWPRILSPLIMGPSREQLKPNQFDRDAGCCEVLFEKDMAIMELLNEVCSTVTHTEKLSPYSAAECRKAVNDTCGVDIAAFLKRSENVGKTSKMLVETMKNSNSSCLREHFGVPIWNLGPHLIQNSWTQPDTLKQERPAAIRGAGPHPALRERGRAIPPGVPVPPTRSPVAMPPNVRVRSSPLSVYFELDIKPPPIPGMRPPLGSPGGPVPAPKSSMGFVMPIYTICIIVFFVYTLSKILFKRTGTSPYEPITPDPQFRRRVFRDDSRTSPDKLVVTAISGLVAEVQQQMEASYAQNQQWQDVQQDNHPRPYTNGTILHNSGPVHIVASEYQEVPTEKASEQKDKNVSNAPETIPEIEETIPEIHENEEGIPEIKDVETEIKNVDTEIENVETEIENVEKIAMDIIDSEVNVEKKESIPEIATSGEIVVTEPLESTLDTEIVKELTPEPIVERELTPEIEKNAKDSTPEPKSPTPEIKSDEEVDDKNSEEEIIEEEEEIEIEPVKAEELIDTPEVIDGTDELISVAANDKKIEKNGDIRKTEEFLHEETSAVIGEKKEKQSTPELLEDAIKDEEENDDNEKSSVKVVGMEMTAHLADGGACGATPPAAPPPRPLAATAPPPRAHEAESVQSIFLETEIPQQSRVLVADFAEDCAEKPQPTKHSPMVVSGKMTLSLIQDAPRDTPERDQESTVDDFTTASAVTQSAAEKEEEESEEEIEEEIEIEEIEEEVEEEEEEELEEKPKALIKKSE